MHERLLYGLLLLTPIIFGLLLYVKAPYGRHHSRGWGIRMANRTAWILMELPAVLIMLYCYIQHSEDIPIANVAYLLIWLFHYLYRTFIFPMGIQSRESTFPIILILFAVIFHVWNGWLNGDYLFRINPIDSWSDLLTPHFIIGTVIFFTGFSIHYRADRTILQLRHGTTERYSIPYGGLFEQVTSPNYLGEIIMWTGWAVLTWSVEGLAFALFTAANLVPRAISNHRWYYTTFADYPKDRKVLLPWVW